MTELDKKAVDSLLTKLYNAGISADTVKNWKSTDVITYLDKVADYKLTPKQTRYKRIDTMAFELAMETIKKIHNVEKSVKVATELNMWDKWATITTDSSNIPSYQFIDGAGVNIIVNMLSGDYDMVYNVPHSVMTLKVSAGSITNRNHFYKMYDQFRSMVLALDESGEADNYWYAGFFDWVDKKRGVRTANRVLNEAYGDLYPKDGVTVDVD